MSSSFLAFPFVGMCNRFWIVDDTRYLSIGLFMVQILCCQLEAEKNRGGPKWIRDSTVDQGLERLCIVSVGLPNNLVLRNLSYVGALFQYGIAMVTTLIPVLTVLGS